MNLTTNEALFIINYFSRQREHHERSSRVYPSNRDRQPGRIVYEGHRPNAPVRLFRACDSDIEGGRGDQAGHRQCAGR